MIHDMVTTDAYNNNNNNNNNNQINVTPFHVQIDHPLINDVSSISSISSIIKKSNFIFIITLNVDNG